MNQAKPVLVSAMVCVLGDHHLWHPLSIASTIKKRAWILFPLLKLWCNFWRDISLWPCVNWNFTDNSLILGTRQKACAGNFAWLQNCVHLWVFFSRYAFWFVLWCQYCLMANKYIKIQVWAGKYYLILFAKKNLLWKIGSKYKF